MKINENSPIETSVIYIGHLPWGFEDKGIQKYFEQFGKITRILVPRSKKVKFLIIILDR
jgi:nucleolar protein 15